MDPALEIVIKKILDIPSSLGPVIISVPVLILSYIVSHKPITQITIRGVAFFINRVTDLIIKAAIGIGGGSLFFILPIRVSSLTSAVLAGAIMFNIANNIDCASLVSKVPMGQDINGNAIGFLEKAPEKNSKVFIKGNENIDLYAPSGNDKEYCSLEYNNQKMEKSNVGETTTELQKHIHRKCEKKFVPLKHRTKTLNYLKKDDSTEHRESAAPYIKRYAERRNRIMNERI